MAYMADEVWPALPYDAWKDTYATLHMWTQVVGKVALAQAPPINHSWGIAMQVTPRGLATRTLPHGAGRSRSSSTSSITSSIVRASDGRRGRCRSCREPWPSSTARSWACCATWVCRWRSGRCRSRFRPRYASMRTRVHHSYDPEYANRFWRILARRSSACSTASRCQLRRQVQSGPFLLGRLRPGGDAILGPARAAARRPRVHARGVFARGHQPRLLARQRPACSSRRSMPTPCPSRPASRRRECSRRRLLPPRAGRVRPAVRGRPHGGRSRWRVRMFVDSTYRRPPTSQDGNVLRSSGRWLRDRNA